MKKIYSLVVASVLCFILASCLKDKKIENREYGMAGLEDIKLAELSASPFEVISLIGSDIDTSFALVTVHLNSEQPAQNDVVVKLSLDQGLLDQYNADNGTDYLFPQASVYSVDDLSVTIPKGSREGQVTITVAPNMLTDGDYAFAFRIESISDPSYVVSANYDEIVTVVGVKNKYDGNYTVRFKTEGWAAYGIADGDTYTWPSNPDGTSIFLITSGSNSVKFFDDWGFGAYIQVAFGDDGSPTGFGATQPKFIFNTATDELIDVVNDATPDARNRAFRINPAVTDSRYDPVEQKIYAAFIMSQTGRPDQYIYDTLTYVGPRP